MLDSVMWRPMRARQDGNIVSDDHAGSGAELIVELMSRHLPGSLDVPSVSPRETTQRRTRRTVRVSAKRTGS